MASNSGWDKTVPSGTSLINVGDDEIRSLKSSLQAWWEEEHYATDGSANSAGEHKQGSARAYVGTSSQLSNPEPGRIFLNSSDSAVWGAYSSSTWVRVASDVQLDSLQTWTARQDFEGGSNTSLVHGAQVGGDSNLRYTLAADGKIEWGGGSGARDTNLYRSAADHLQTDDKFEASSLVVGGGSAIAAIASGSTVLASTITLNSGSEANISLVNSDSNITFGDPVFVGFRDDNSSARVLATGRVESSRSIGIQFHNPTGVTRTLPSGQTIRYVAFRF